MQIRDRIKEFRRVKASTLRPSPKNWRTHPESQRNAIKGILAEVGYVDAIMVRELADGSLEIVDGHLRAESTPDSEVPVLVVDLNDAEAAKVLATFDPIGAMADSDAKKLDELLREVETGNEALQELLAETAKDAGLYLDEKKTIEEDEVPEPPVEPKTKPGDLYILGEHRLLCGDSTKAEDVKRLMGDERASCVFTDPPYGVSIAAKNRTLNSFPNPEGGWNSGKGRNVTNIADDDLSPTELKERLLPAFENLRSHVMSDDCTLFVSAPQIGELCLMMMMMMMDAKLAARHVLIWKKNQPTFSMGRLDYDYQHEPILMTWGKRHKRPMKGNYKTGVWDIDKPRKSGEHPTMKPVELYANAYLNNSEDGDIVVDIYGGSGTAVIAAEQVSRKARLIEISPTFCDVIVERWEKFTGKTAELVAGGI